LNAALAGVDHGLDKFTIHDLRRTMRTHLSSLGIRSEVAERCLSHTLPGIQGVYNTHDYFAERKAALETWTALLLEIERGQRVLQDSELAALYGVSTKRFNEQVRRNRKRFPADFMFQLTAEEISSSRSQIATLKAGRGQHRKYPPYVFTEHGRLGTTVSRPRGHPSLIGPSRSAANGRSAIGHFFVPNVICLDAAPRRQVCRRTRNTGDTLTRNSRTVKVGAIIFAPISVRVLPAHGTRIERMDTTRRDLLTAALTAAGASMTANVGQAKEADHPHDHDHQAVPSDPALRVKALESLLVAKGLVDRAALDELIDTYAHKVGPRNGARVVARAWTDADYKRRLLANADAAISELGYGGMQGEHMVVVENTATVHNLVVCTLCSCYPWPVLGLPPVWYKSAPYRSRSVIDPRGVLREFGLDLPTDVEVRVWDSTAELRYLVLPERPAHTETLTEAELAALVTRDAMVGVAKVISQRDVTSA